MAFNCFGGAATWMQGGKVSCPIFCRDYFIDGRKGRVFRPVSAASSDQPKSFNRMMMLAKTKS
jgi:hypothetical protein